MEFTKVFTLVLLMGIVGFSSAARLPESFKRCKANDPNLSKCLQGNVYDAIQQLASGLPSFGMLPLDPLLVTEINLPGGKGPINFSQKYTNLTIRGIKGCVITGYKADLQKKTLYTYSKCPKISLIGDYVVDGSILVLPIKGNGLANITLSDVEVIHDLQFESFKKKEKEYFKCVEYKAQIKPQNVNYYFDNLFNGDERLGKQMNNFIAENSKEIYNEFRPGFEEAFSLIFLDYTNKIFTRVPIKDIFIP